jgi:transcriptional regulator with XRE-family HTH domain
MEPDAAGETIGRRLKRLRLERGLSQRELAAPGVSYAYISRIEAGSRQPSVKALRKLAAKLGVSAGYLETGSDLDSAQAIELRLSDIELAIRLGRSEGAEQKLHEVSAEAAASADATTVRRAHIALAELAHERGAFDEAVGLLEAAIAGESFSPIECVDVYSQLGRAYAAAGRKQEAALLFERCLDALPDDCDPTLEARYATLLSYALSDMGELGRAEEVVRRALERVQGSADPYTRVRLYWSLARLAYSEGRQGVALANVRKAIALLETADDSLHLGRAHLLAAHIVLGREDADAARRHLGEAERLFGGTPPVQDRTELTILRSRVERLGNAPDAALALAREALALASGRSTEDEGYALAALADAQALAGDRSGADASYRRAVDLLEGEGLWRDAAQTCRTWGNTLRESGSEEQAMDVLDRAAELGMRASPQHARAER